jgi:mannosyltransferase
MLELGLALEELGHRVTVVTHDHDPGTDFSDVSHNLDIRAVRTGSFSPPAGRRGLLGLYGEGMRRVAELVPDDADIVNAHEWPALRAGRIAAGRLGVPLVWTRNDETTFERGVLPGEGLFDPPGLTGRAARVALGWPDFLDGRRAGAIVVLDSRNASAVERVYRRPARILRCGPPATFFDPPDRSDARARLGVADEAFLAFAFGILFPHRRFEDLIEAVASLAPESNVRARIVGSDHADPAYADKLTRLIADRAVGDRVELVRRSVSEDELRDLYAGSDVSVFPNRRQAYGLAPLESIASRTPVVLSTGIGVKEVLEGRPGVWMVPPERPDVLAAALREVQQSDVAAGLAETREWIRTDLSNARYAQRMAAIFDELRSSARA